MKVGIVVNFTSADLIEEQFSNMKKHHFDNCQLICWDMSLYTDENVELINGLLEKYSITVSAFWAGWEGPKVWNFYDGQLTLGLVPIEFRQMRLQNLIDGADFAHKLHITDVATHMGYIPENPNDPNFRSLCMSIRYLAEHMKKNNQYLLFETGQETPITMLRCFEEVGTDNLGVNLDSSNLITYGKGNPVDSLDVFGKYVRGIHAKDGVYPTDGFHTGHQVKVGTGKVDFKAMFAGLHKLGYDGYVTIEREIEGEQQLIDILESREYLEKIIQEVCC